MQALGVQVRKQRRRLGLTLDELAGKSQISKPYLSLIETGRIGNPPSDEKLRRLEETLGFTTGELVTQAHLHRTPRDVRTLLLKLMADRQMGMENVAKPASKAGGKGAKGSAAVEGAEAARATPQAGEGVIEQASAEEVRLSGVLRDLLVKTSESSMHAMVVTVPVLNRRTMAYPRDFGDMTYPAKVAEEYVACPDVSDKDAFAARVHGDSMRPRYREGDIVIFAPGQSARNGDDCFIRMKNGQTTFRRVFFESGADGEAAIRLQPRNERHRAEVIASKEVAGMYRAVYRYHELSDE